MEQFCTKAAGRHLQRHGLRRRADHGRLRQQVVVTERFVLRIPDAHRPRRRRAAALRRHHHVLARCSRWGAGPGKKVAVVGMGGLGHMGVKIAAAMGAEVTVLSRSMAKAGRRRGARRDAALSPPSDADAFQAARGSFDLIINTVSADIADRRLPARCSSRPAPWSTSALPPSPLRDPAAARSSAATRPSPARSIGGIAETQEMLDFCAEHGIGAEIEIDRRRPTSTRPTTGSSTATCATASSSTRAPSPG